jgi:glycosyltransferase involved in cell wall biosynthesis
MGDPVRAREQLGDGPLVVYSGNLDRYQDLDLLLEGFGLVAVSRPDARLVISTSADPGRVRDHARLKGIAAQTVFLPADEFVSVRDLLAAADVTVCPRQVCLGFPIKLLNYMAAGRPIVASKGSACGLRHLENGWVVQNGDAPAMAAAITALLGDPGRAETLGAGAQRTARTEHDWDRAVEAIGEVYDRIAIGR